MAITYSPFTRSFFTVDLQLYGETLPSTPPRLEVGVGFLPKRRFTQFVEVPRHTPFNILIGYKHWYPHPAAGTTPTCEPEYLVATVRRAMNGRTLPMVVRFLIPYKEQNGKHDRQVLLCYRGFVTWIDFPEGFDHKTRSSTWSNGSDGSQLTIDTLDNADERLNDDQTVPPEGVTAQNRGSNIQGPRQGQFHGLATPPRHCHNDDFRPVIHTPDSSWEYSTNNDVRRANDIPRNVDLEGLNLSEWVAVRKTCGFVEAVDPRQPRYYDVIVCLYRSKSPGSCHSEDMLLDQFRLQCVEDDEYSFAVEECMRDETANKMMKNKQENDQESNQYSKPQNSKVAREKMARLAKEELDRQFDAHMDSNTYTIYKETIPDDNQLEDQLRFLDL